MRDVFIVGVHTTRFGKDLGRGIKDLTADTVRGCLADAGLERSRLEAAWFANSAWGYAKGQTCIRGQVALRPLGIGGIPITNVENACAGGSTALHQAWCGVAGGLYDVTLAVGAEKLHDPNRLAVFAGFLGGIDIENCLELAGQLAGLRPDPAAVRAFRQAYPAAAAGRRKRRSLTRRARQLKDALVVATLFGERLGYDTVLKLGALAAREHSPFMEIYGYAARQHMQTHGSTVEQLAAIAAKNHCNGALNPNAQYRTERSVAEVLTDRLVSFPLTRAMCAPIGDGAASAILCSESAVGRHGLAGRAVRVRASVLGSAGEGAEGAGGGRLATLAYERAGLGPEAIDLAEVHDATAFGELALAETLGFCAPGEGGVIAARGETALGGRIPLNPSGGLIARGHPVGASGLAQVHELVTQLRGEAAGRQVARARRGLAENGGGFLGGQEAAICIHVLEAPGRSPRRRRRDKRRRG